MTRRFPRGGFRGAKRGAPAGTRGRIASVAAAVLLWPALCAGPLGAAPIRAAEVPSPDAAGTAAAVPDRTFPAGSSVRSVAAGSDVPVSSAAAGAAVDPKTPPAASAASPAGEERRELWTGSLYTSTYRIGLCVAPTGEARGVVLLRIYNGDVDVYHVEGVVRNGRITARHHSGHRFEGKYTSPDTVDGVITLKSGRKVSLTAKRTPHARLTGDDCRPLPE